MKKTLFTAVLACVIAVSGFVAAAQESVVSFDSKNKTFSSNVSKRLALLVTASSSSGVDLKEKLTAAVSGTGDQKGLVYLKGGSFVSLADAIQKAKVETDEDGKQTAFIQLGEFDKNETFQLGYQNSDFASYDWKKIEGDPGYYTGYSPEGFYQLDFSSDPFDGKIDIVIGEPLPAPVVTLLVALASGALFLLYKNRRQRFIQTEHA